jgi:hypothetical protein
MIRGRTRFTRDVQQCKWFVEVQTDVSFRPADLRPVKQALVLQLPFRHAAV